MNDRINVPHMQDVARLKANVRTLWDVARKRINRLNDPAIVGHRLGGAVVANDFGAPASSASNDPVTLRREYIRLYNFLNSQTSTVSGFKSWYDKQEKVWNIGGLDADSLDDFWTAYDKARKAAALVPGSYDSTQIVRALGSRIITTGGNPVTVATDIFAIVRALHMTGNQATTDAILEAFDPEE